MNNEYDFIDSENVTKSSSESLNKLKRLSANLSLHNKPQNNSNQTISNTMPNIYKDQNQTNLLYKSSVYQSQENTKSINSSSHASQGAPHSENTSQNTINEVEYLNLNFNNLSGEEIKNQLEIIKYSYEKKLASIDNLYKQVKNKDEKINNLSVMLSNLLKEEETETSLMDKQTKEVSELKFELNNLKRKHNKNLLDIEKESEENLKNNLEKIRDEYNMRIREFSETHDKTIKNLQEEILSLKEDLDSYENKEFYLTKNEHEEILIELKNNNKNELNTYEKEIELLEILIKENYSQLQTRNKNCNTINEDSSNFLNFAEFQKELQNGNENNDIICMISHLDTPIGTNFQNANTGNTVQLNANKVLHYNYFTNFNSDKYNLELEEENVTMEEPSSVYEEVEINKINNLKIDKAESLLNKID